MIEKFRPHLIALIAFLIASCLYFTPALSGKKMSAHDNIGSTAAAKEFKDYKDKGETILWTNRVFGGMPLFQISYEVQSNLTSYFYKVRSFLATEIDILFVLMTCFYAALLLFGARWQSAIPVAISFGLSTWFLLSVEAGHNSKMYAIGYAALILGGLYNSYYGKTKYGYFFLGLGMSMIVGTSHFQIAYYAGIMAVILAIFIFIDFIQKKEIGKFIKTSAIAILFTLVGLLTNTVVLWTNYEYAKETMRGGKSELTKTENKEINTKSTGLNIDYAFAWSYGKLETFNLLVPNFMGGGSGQDVETASSKLAQMYNTGEAYTQLPTYWGDQPFTSGPTYLGVIIIFLFMMYMLTEKSNTKWALLSIAVFSILMAWGRHFLVLNQILFDYLPMYNKFRTPSMSLTMTTIAVFIGAGSFLSKLFSGEISKEEILKTNKKAFYVVGGLSLLAIVLGFSFLDFSSATTDKEILTQNPSFPIDLLKADRKSLLMSDAFRSLFLACLAFGIIWAWATEKIKKASYLLIALGLLSVLDLWLVDKKYVNSRDYTSVTKLEDFIQMSPADAEILKDQSGTYRVFNTTINAFNDNNVGYYHNNVGGYSPAKLFRYQDLIENHLSKGSMPVFNMLNTKYFISQGQNGQPIPQKNPDACGNAWFAQNIDWAKNADDEITKLSTFNPKTTVVVDERFKQDVPSFSFDSLSTISLSKYHPDKMEYTSNNSQNQFAVFSEIWYNGNKDWKAYIDGKEAKMVRVNYLLRGLNIPQGKHNIVFEFKPDSYYKGNLIGYICSVILILLGGALIFWDSKKQVN